MQSRKKVKDKEERPQKYRGMFLLNHNVVGYPVSFLESWLISDAISYLYVL